MELNCNRVLSIALFSLLGACTSSELVQPSEAVSTPWRQIAIDDLKAIRRHTIDSHPGYVDRQNPEFAQIADEAMRDALALTRQVTDGAGFAAVLKAYSARFRDGHYVAYALADKLEQERDRHQWPGIFLGWRNDRVLVTHSPDNPNLIGATLDSCNGTAATILIRDNVFRFDPGKPTQPAYWARLAHRLFIDNDNPFVDLPSECSFTHQEDGTEQQVTLTWRALDRDAYRTMARESQFGGVPAPGIYNLKRNQYWINLPDFSPSGETFEQMTELIRRLSELQDHLRSAEVLVFDMRGNQGGNSVWGVRAIDAIWGKEYRQSRSYGSVYADWRISPGNVEHAAHLVRILKEQGAKDALSHFKPIAKALAKALAKAQRDQDYHRAVSTAAVKKVETVNNPVQARVLLLTHGACASSCLDFVDEMLALENVTQIGYPTGSDTNYLELRHIELPSGRARLALPVKVYRGRPRASREYYSPAYRYDGFDWSDEGIEAWVVEEVLR